MLKIQTQLKTSKPKLKIKKESHQTNKDYFSLKNNLKMEELFQTITFKKNLISTYFIIIHYRMDKFKSRAKKENPFFWMLKPQIQFYTSKPKFKIKKEFHQISRI